MRKKILAIIVILLSLLLITSCIKGSSYFSIQFIDVGQGDAALVECNRKYMLIDGGDKSAGDTVYRVLKERGIDKLDILAISHFDSDHIGGLDKALTYASKISLTIANSDFENRDPDESGDDNTKAVSNLRHRLIENEAKIIVPEVGKTYKLGDAKIEVVDVSAEKRNDSLVLLVTYGKTSFLFTGDIEENGQERLINRLQDGGSNSRQIDLIKFPHHGAKSYKCYQFLRTIHPKYAVISVGKNDYGHPDEDTLSKLRDADVDVYRTDKMGNIYVKSDGETISIETRKD